MGTEPFNPDDGAAVLDFLLPPEQRPSLTTDDLLRAFPAWSRRQIERWSQKGGALPCSHAGNERLYAPADVRRFVRETKVNAPRD